MQYILLVLAFECQELHRLQFSNHLDSHQHLYQLDKPTEHEIIELLKVLTKYH